MWLWALVGVYGVFYLKSVRERDYVSALFWLFGSVCWIAALVLVSQR
jgi:hypothetical protein